MKKNYSKPAMRVVKLKYRSLLQLASPFQVGGNALSGGGSDADYTDYDDYGIR